MVEVAAANILERGILENLLQIHIHNFSGRWSGTTRGEVGDDGRFASYPWLDTYWREPGRAPLLLRRAGFLIGFALINRHAHSGLLLDWSMAEFFILEKHRRAGAGNDAARAIFQCYPGQWEVAVARGNLAALAFWRKAVAGCPGVSGMEELDRADEAWNGPILRFRVALITPAPDSHARRPTAASAR